MTLPYPQDKTQVLQLSIHIPLWFSHCRFYQLHLSDHPNYQPNVPSILNGSTFLDSPSCFMSLYLFSCFSLHLVKTYIFFQTQLMPSVRTGHTHIKIHSDFCHSTCNFLFSLFLYISFSDTNLWSFLKMDRVSFILISLTPKAITWSIDKI